MHRRSGVNKKLIGGTNFIVVLWALLSLLRLALAMGRDFMLYFKSVNFASFLIPLLFLILLNLFIGIMAFSKSGQHNIWLLSIVILAITLVTLNSVHSKIDQIRTERKITQVVEF